MVIQQQQEKTLYRFIKSNERRERERRNTIIAASHRIVRLCELEAPNIVWTVLGTKYDHSEIYKVCLEWNTFSTSHIQARTAFSIRLMLDSSESHTCVLQNKSWAANVFVCQTSVNNSYAHGQLSISLSLSVSLSLIRFSFFRTAFTCTKTVDRQFKHTIL